MLKTAWPFSNDMAFISFHAKLQLLSIIIVDVTAVGVINRVGLMLPPMKLGALLQRTIRGTVPCEWHTSR